jgi:hypothetical protein
MSPHCPLSSKAGWIQDWMDVTDDDKEQEDNFTGKIEKVTVELK